jgi:hypothetical protein
MRTVYLILVVLFFNTTAFASEIREFDIKTLEKLGNELTRVSQQPDRGATTPVRKRARETTIAALKGKLFKCFLSCRAESRHLILLTLLKVRDSSTSLGMTQAKNRS